MTYVYLLLAIAAEVVATSALKTSEGFSKLGVVVINAFSTTVRV